MINVNAVKQEVDFLARKHQTGASITPAQFNIAAQGALRDFVKIVVGPIQQYQKGAPFAAISWEQTALVNDYLSPFKVTDFLLAISSSGSAPKPPDYMYRSKLMYKKFTSQTQADDSSVLESCGCGCGNLKGRCSNKTYKALNAPAPLQYTEVPIEIVDDLQWEYRLNSVNRFPTVDAPIARFDKGAIKFFPFNLGKAYLTYLQSPNTNPPVWGYTNTIPPQYDPLTSTDFNLPDICQTDIVILVLKRCGISIREDLLLAYAADVKQQGT